MVFRTIKDNRSYVRNLLWLTLESGARVQIDASQIDVADWDPWASTNPALTTLLEAAVFPARTTSVLHVTALRLPPKNRRPYSLPDARVVESFHGPTIEMYAGLLNHLKFRVKLATLRGAVGRGAYLGAEIALQANSPNAFNPEGQDAGPETSEALMLLRHYWCARRAAVTAHKLTEALSPRDDFTNNRGGAIRATKPADVKALEVAVRDAATSLAQGEVSRHVGEAHKHLLASAGRRALWGGLAEVAAVMHAHGVPLDPSVTFSSAWRRLTGPEWDDFESVLRRLPTWNPRDVTQVLPTATALVPLLSAVVRRYEGNTRGRR